MKTLIVEDSDLIRTNLADIFKEFENVNLLQAGNGLDALKIFENESPELVILDLGLPYLSGFEVLRKCKNRTPSATIIVFTNYSEEYYIEICKKYGADYFFDKSTQFDEFILKIKEIIK
jgi:DNA-binding response OmpR family regulator